MRGFTFAVADMRPFDADGYRVTPPDPRPIGFGQDVTKPKRERAKKPQPMGFQIIR